MENVHRHEIAGRNDRILDCLLTANSKNIESGMVSK